MRLLRYEGDVEIEGASGKPRDVAVDEVLNSGDLLKTGEDSSASVALDEGRIITLDEKSQVEFLKQDGAVEIDVKEGGAFLDVSEKLSSDETMDIKVSGVTVGIRGTIVFVNGVHTANEAPARVELAKPEDLSSEKGLTLSVPQIGVLEGTAQISLIQTIPTVGGLSLLRQARKSLCLNKAKMPKESRSSLSPISPKRISRALSWNRRRRTWKSSIASKMQPTSWTT